MAGRWFAAAILAATVCAQSAAAQEVSLSARAGLGGLARPGRWTPVQVSVESGTDLQGHLILEWGGSRVVRDVLLGAGVRRVVEMQIRATDVRDVITVRLESTGRARATTMAPVRLVGVDEEVTVCINTLPPERVVSCATSVYADNAPRTWRSYDAADTIVPDAPSSGFTPEQRAAITLWRQARASQEAGSTPVAGVVPEAPPPGRQAAPLLWLYPGALAGLLLLQWAWRDVRGISSGAFVAVTVVAGVTASLAGRTASVTVHHASTLEAFEGGIHGLVNMRAVALFPTNAEHAVRGNAPTQTIDRTRGGADRIDERFEDNGLPLLAGRFGFGERRGFSLHGTTDMAVLAAASEGAGVRVTNATALALESCEWPEAVGLAGPVTLAPGASVLVPRRPPDGATVTCRLPGPPVALQAGSRAVTAVGTTVVSLHLAAGSAGL